jgi:hypothetical protein
VLGPASESTLVTRAALGMAYREIGRVADSIDLLEHVLADCEPELRRGDKLTNAVGTDLIRSYFAAGRRREAKALSRRLKAAYRDYVATRWAEDRSAQDQPQ